MALVLPARPRSGLASRFYQALGPGGEVQAGAGRLASAFARSQIEGLDPRSWNDPVTPQFDAAGREVNAGVFFPVSARAAQGLPKLEEALRGLELTPLSRGNRRVLGRYGDETARQANLDPRLRRLQEKRDALAEMEIPYDQQRGDYRIDPDSIGPAPPSGLPVSWDGPGRPLPPQSGKGALDLLLEQIRPKQGKQLGVWDDEFEVEFNPADPSSLDYGPDWWKQGQEGSPLERPYYAQPGPDPLSHQLPGKFRPIANHPLQQEEWINRTNRREDMRLPGHPRDDALGELGRYGRARYDTARLKRVRDDLRIRRQEGVNMPPPPHPQAGSEHYYPGAELNLVGKTHPLVERLVRLSRGRRGGV